MGKGSMKPGRKPMFDEKSTVVAVRLPVSDAKKIPGNKSKWIRDCIFFRLKINECSKTVNCNETVHT